MPEKSKLVGLYVLVGIYLLVNLVYSIIVLNIGDIASSAMYQAALVFSIASLVIGFVCLIVMFIEFFTKRINFKRLIIGLVILGAIYILPVIIGG